MLKKISNYYSNVSYMVVWRKFKNTSSYFLGRLRRLGPFCRRRFCLAIIVFKPELSLDLRAA